MRHMYNIRRGVTRIKTKTTTTLTILGVTVLAAAFCLAGSAVTSASPGNLYVGHGSTGNNKNCSSPGYNSVQTAVNAASNGGTVYLCGAQFSEQVFVKKSITLTGDAGSGLTATGTTFSTNVADFPAPVTSQPQALLVSTGNNVTVKGLKISGPFANSKACAQDDYGILALDGSINLKNDTVSKVADVDPGLYGCQFGVGIQVGRTAWNSSASADIDGTTVNGYQKNGITVDNTGSSANIDNSTVVGGGYAAPFGSIIAQNGIQISRGAKGSVEDSTIADNAYSGGNYATSAGILVYGGGGDPVTKNVAVNDNKLINNDVAVNFANYNDDFSGPAAAQTKNDASGNWVFSSKVTNVSGLCDGNASCGGTAIGYQAGIEDVGNKDSACHNTISGPGYTEEGDYDYSVTPPVFTQTPGGDLAVVRDIDAGDTFPTTNFQSCEDYHHGNGHYNKNFFNHYHSRFNHWYSH